MLGCNYRGDTDVWYTPKEGTGTGKLEIFVLSENNKTQYTGCIILLMSSSIADKMCILW